MKLYLMHSQRTWCAERFAPQRAQRHGDTETSSLCRLCALCASVVEALPWIHNISVGTALRILSACALAVSIQMAALSQSPGKPQGQTNSGVLLETTEVVVDVVVRDKKGQPVKDLTQADFQVYEDDALQKIKSFRLIARDPCLSCDGGMVNLIALVFDRLSPEACILARQAAMKYVNENLKPSDMVGVFAVDASLRTLQLYTNDADLIRRGIDRALSQCSSNPYGSGKAEKLAPQYVKIKSGCRPQPLAPLASDPVLVRKETIEALEHDRQGYAAVASLLDVIRGLHNATGRKAVIYFSEGVAISTAVQSHFRAVISAANRANVSIYAIDVAGLRVESGTADARREIDDIVKKRMTQLEDGVGEEMGRPMMRDLERNEKLIRLDPSASLSHLAHETGGFFINNTNDLAAGLRRIDEEIRTHYVMTYEPANTNYDGNFRQIRVKLNRADLRAQTRKGYYALKPGTRAQPLDYEVPALAALNSITLPASFPLRAAGFHFPEADQPTLAPALVEVPAIAFTFTPDNGKKVYRADFSILVLIKGRSGQVFRKLSKHYQLTGPLNKLEEARRGNILFYRDAQLEPGRYTLHAVAYDAPSGKASARTLELEVPDLGEKQPGMSSLVILKGVERLGAGERQAANPFHYGEVVVYPNLGEPLRKDRTKQLAFYYTAYPRQGFTALRQTVEVLQHGRVIGRVTGELPAPDAAGRIQYASALPLDALPLQHGEYELKVTVFEGNEAVSRSARFVIEDAAGAGVPTLELRQPVERELAAGQAHAYRVNLAAGQYLSVAVNQKGIDVEVVLLGPDGNLLNSNNEAGGPQGTERLSWIAESAGSYGLEVRPALEKGVAGRYEIHIEELRTPTEKEKLSAAALRISQEALKLYDPHQKQDAESRRQAIARHQEALALYRRAEDQQGQAIALLNLGDDYRRLKDQQKAQESYEGALFHARAAGARSLEAYILISLGRLYEGSDPPDKQKTQTYYEQALAIYQETGDIEWQMSMLNNLAGIYLELGDPDKAIATYEQEIKLGQAYGIVFSAPAILAKYMTTAQMFTAMGEVDKAAEYYAKALEVSKALEEKGGMRQWVHTSLALTYRKLGDRQKELVYWYQALAHAGHRAEEMIALLAIAGVYAQFEDRQRAQQYLDRVLQIGRAILEKDEDWRTLQILGWAYSMMGDKRKALDHFEQALALNRAASREGEAGGEVLLLYNLGDAHRDLGERDKALAYYERALAHRMAARENLQEQAIAGLQTKQEIIRPVIDEELDVLNSIGQLYTAMANEQKAAEYFQHALSLGKTAANPGRQAQALYNLAQIARKRGDLQHARAQIEEALQLVESMRAKMSDEGLRSAYFATVQDYYEFYVSLLMQLHKQNGAAGLDRLALEAAERGRARTLLDLLREAGTDIRQGIGPELLKREFQVRQQLRAKAEAQVRLLANRRAPQQEEQIRKEIAALETEYQQVRAAIRSKRPQYAALTQPQLLSAREIQEKLLDADTLLLEYALGKERSYLWAVTPEAIASYELPGRAEIEEAARRVYRLLTARQPVHGEREAQYRARAAQADAQYWPEAARLSRMLLGPVASQLGAKRLLVVADGALHYIPFAALPSPVQAAANQGDAPPLIVHHEILNLPSASALGVLREETAARKPAPKTVAVLADPVFDKDDDRVRKQPGAKRSEQKPQEDAPVSRSERALREFDISAPGMGIPRLPFSREEAEAITALSPADALKALGFAANRATVVSPEMGRYRVVHFATHGLLNSHHPDLSGLLLSLVDEQGNPQDGFLQLHEVYNLNLPADLVVLSACQTALGKEVKGEGLVGLTRGFMYAGAQRVMASLWKVNDASTAVFMKRFYGGMLKEGLRPAAALRAAQIEMAKQKLWQSPYYWAAFVIQGEWR